MKIDVEGHEPRVFAGASELLRSTQFFAFFEVSRSQLTMSGFDPSEFLQRLTDLGRLYEISERAR